MQRQQIIDYINEHRLSEKEWNLLGLLSRMSTKKDVRCIVGHTSALVYEELKYVQRTRAPHVCYDTCIRELNNAEALEVPRSASKCVCKCTQTTRENYSRNTNKPSA